MTLEVAPKNTLLWACEPTEHIHEPIFFLVICILYSLKKLIWRQFSYKEIYISFQRMYYRIISYEHLGTGLFVSLSSWFLYKLLGEFVAVTTLLKWRYFMILKWHFGWLLFKQYQTSQLFREQPLPCNWSAKIDKTKLLLATQKQCNLW